MDFDISDVKSIDINSIDNLLGKIKLIDIREVYEYEAGTLKTAVNIPMGNLLESPEEYLNKDEEYYIMCRADVRSMKACILLSEEGYNVIDVGGGIINYLGDNIVKGE